LNERVIITIRESSETGAVMIPAKVASEKEWLDLEREVGERNFVNAAFVNLMLQLSKMPSPTLRLTTIGVYTWCPACGKVTRNFGEEKCQCGSEFHPARVVVRAPTWKCAACGRIQKFNPFGVAVCGCGVRSFYAIVLRKMQKLIRTGNENEVFRAIVDTLMPYHSRKEVTQGGDKEEGAQ